MDARADEADKKSDHSLEARSLCAEIDYTKKDAAQHIVQNEANSRKQKLKDRILKNLEGVRTGQASIVKSQIGSTRSSHATQMSIGSARRASQVHESIVQRASKPNMEKIHED